MPLFFFFPLSSPFIPLPSKKNYITDIYPLAIVIGKNRGPEYLCPVALARQ